MELNAGAAACSAPFGENDYQGRKPREKKVGREKRIQGSGLAGEPGAGHLCVAYDQACRKRHGREDGGRSKVEAQASFAWPLRWRWVVVHEGKKGRRY